MSTVSASIGSCSLPSISRVNDLGAAGGELEALAPQRLDEDRELQLAATLDDPGIPALGVLHAQPRTLPISSASSRLLSIRAVSWLPSRPDSGEVLMPISIERLGSSTVMTGSGCGSSRLASVSADGDLGDAGDRGDLARPRLLRLDALERLGHVELAQGRALDRPVAPAPRDLLASAQRAVDHAT